MESSGSTSSSCTCLPDELLELILTKLNPLSGDYFRFGAVCKDWYKIMKYSRTLIRSATQIPLLMVPSNKKVKTRRSFYDITHSTRFDSVHPRVPYNIKACGSSYGWLVYIEKTMVIVLYNPFAKQSRKTRDNNVGLIRLPPVLLIPNAEPYEYSVHKVILFGNPSLSKDYVVVAFYGDFGRLAIWKASSMNKEWIHLEDKVRYDVNRCFNDAIMYKGLIYAVNAAFGIISINPFDKEGDNNNIEVKEVIMWPFIPWIPTYLVESTKGELILMRRILEKYDHDCYLKTSNFEVYKLKTTEQNCKLERIDSLDGDTIFVGDGKSICVAACDFDNCRPDSIYYTDDGFHPWIIVHDGKEDYHDGPRDTGIFSLQDRSIKPLYPYDLAHKYLPPAIWVTPMF